MWARLTPGDGQQGSPLVLQDLGRTPMVMGKPAAMVEKYKMTLSSLGGDKGRLMLEWDNTSAHVDFTVK